MATYCFRCPLCGRKTETTSREPAPTCTGPYKDDDYGRHFALEMVRDFKAEGFGIGSGVRVSRDGTVAEQARLFLPDNSEFAGPGDPDGTKGAREWLETHQPKTPQAARYKIPGLEFERKSF